MKRYALALTLLAILALSLTSCNSADTKSTETADSIAILRDTVVVVDSSAYFSDSAKVDTAVK